jgi:signal transduction histidine kinase
VVIMVRDEGIGIPEQELGKIFDTLYRVDHSPGRIFPGTGLGLALVREIILIHGGSIRVESRVGRGSAFHIRLLTMSDYGGRS